MKIWEIKDDKDDDNSIVKWELAWLMNWIYAWRWSIKNNEEICDKE